jgi:hypothetical protein
MGEPWGIYCNISSPPPMPLHQIGLVNERPNVHRLAAAKDLSVDKDA